jgi:hypothetical protein
MRLIRLLPLFLLSIAAIAQSPSWVNVVPASAQPNGKNITISLPAGARYRFFTPLCGLTGQPASYVGTISLIGPETISDYDDGLAGRPADPCSGTAKQLDVEQTAVTQIVTVTTSGKAVPITVAALTPPPPPPPPVAADTPVTYRVTCANVIGALTTHTNGQPSVFDSDPTTTLHCTFAPK